MDVGQSQIKRRNKVLEVLLDSTGLHRESDTETWKSRFIGLDYPGSNETQVARNGKLSWVSGIVF